MPAKIGSPAFNKHVYDQNLYWGGGGGQWWWMGRGVAVKDASSGVVGVGVIEGSFQKHLKTVGAVGWVKANVVRRAEGF